MSSITEAFEYALEHSSGELADRTPHVEQTLAAFADLESTLAGGEAK